MEVNRHLEDPEMDRIDHALGRPLDPMGETSRNGFVTDYGCSEGAELRASPLWSKGRRWLGDSEAFHVTDEGRATLAEYLQKTGDPHRRFAVTFRGHTRTIVAKTGPKARYRRFLDMDATDITFGDYCRDARVRLAR